MSNTVSFLALFIAISIAGVVSTRGQVTIFNIPTTDTQPRRTFVLEGDFITKPVRTRDGGYRAYGYRTVYGLNHKTDVGANFFFTRDARGSSAEMQFNAKRRLYYNERRGFAVSAGTLVFFPLRNISPTRAGAMFYANASKKVSAFRGVRLTSGVYSVFGGGREFGTKNGGMLGVEQSLTRRISFLADWSSGNNRFGYAAAGLNFTITNHQYILAGYNFGNSGRGNNALSAFYGYTF